MIKLKDILTEKLEIDLKVGDTILRGKFKNKPVVVKDIGTDEHGQPTVNGKKMLSFRIKKLMPQKTNEGTCGYGINGEIDDKPAGPHLLDYEQIDQVEEDVRKRGNKYCAYVDDKLTKAEKEGNPKKYKGKKVGSTQKTKSGKIRMKARACYGSRKKANNAMAAAMMG